MQEEPTYPALNLSIAPQGLMVGIQLGPYTSINQLIAAETMDELVKKWRDQRRATSGQKLDIIRSIGLSHSEP
jgi:hypothetical protein